MHANALAPRELLEHGTRHRTSTSPITGYQLTPKTWSLASQPQGWRGLDAKPWPQVVATGQWGSETSRSHAIGGAGSVVSVTLAAGVLRFVIVSTWSRHGEGEVYRNFQARLRRLS